MFIVSVLVLDRLSQCRIEGTGIVGTRTVPVPESGEPNIQGTRTVPVPGSGEPNIQGTRTERLRYPSFSWSLELEIDRSVRLIGCVLIMALV